MAVATLTFGDRVAAEVERKRSQLIVGLDPLPVSAGRAWRRRRAILLRDGRRGGPRGRGQATARALRGARGRRHGGLRRDVRVRAARRPLVIADGKRGDIGSTARAYSAAYLQATSRSPARYRQPLSRPRVDRALSRRSAAAGRGHLLHRQDLERGRRRSDVALSDGRPLGSTSRRSSQMGRGSDRRARPLRGRRGRRRKTRARRRRSPQADAAGDSASSRRRAQGASPGDSPCLHEPAQARWSTRRARSTTPSVSRATTTRRRPVPKQRALQRDLGGVRVVAVPAGPGWRMALPALFLVAVTLGVVGMRAALPFSAAAPRSLTSLTSRSPRGITACGRATHSPPCRKELCVGRPFPHLNPKLSRPRSSSASESASSETHRSAALSPSDVLRGKLGDGVATEAATQMPGWSERRRTGARWLDPNEEHVIASITKLMTVPVVLDHHKLLETSSRSMHGRRSARRASTSGRASSSRSPT